MTSISKHPFARLLEKMEDMVLAGIGVPLTPWTIVNGDTLVPLLDRIRETLPEELRQAKDLLAQQEALLVEAQLKAQRMLDEAREYAEQMVNESELMKAVHLEANRVREVIMTELETARRKTLEECDAIKRQAYEEAKTVREGAEIYAENVLSSLDKQLTDCQQIVRNGQRYLKRNQTSPSQPGSVLSNKAASKLTAAQQQKIRESLIRPQHHQP